MSRATLIWFKVGPPSRKNPYYHITIIQDQISHSHDFNTIFFLYIARNFQYYIPIDSAFHVNYLLCTYIYKSVYVYFSKKGTPWFIYLYHLHMYYMYINLFIYNKNFILNWKKIFNQNQLYWFRPNILHSVLNRLFIGSIEMFIIIIYISCLLNCFKFNHVTSKSFYGFFENEPSLYDLLFREDFYSELFLNTYIYIYIDL